MFAHEYISSLSGKKQNNPRHTHTHTLHPTGICFDRDRVPERTFSASE